MFLNILQLVVVIDGLDIICFSNDSIPKTNVENTASFKRYVNVILSVDWDRY